MPDARSPRASALVGVLAVGLLLAACEPDGRSATRSDANGEPTSTTAHEEDVVVRGPVRRTVASNLFEVGETDAEPVLVLLVATGVQAPREGDVVEVTGPIRRLDIPALEAEFRVSLPASELEAFEGKSCVIARSLDVAAVDEAEHSRDRRRETTGKGIHES